MLCFGSVIVCLHIYIYIYTRTHTRNYIFLCEIIGCPDCGYALILQVSSSTLQYVLSTFTFLPLGTCRLSVVTSVYMFGMCCNGTGNALHSVGVCARACVHMWGGGDRQSRKCTKCTTDKVIQRITPLSFWINVVPLLFDYDWIM